MPVREFDASFTRTNRPGQTAAAAIAEIARRHGVDASPRGVVAHAGWAAASTSSVRPSRPP